MLGIVLVGLSSLAFASAAILARLGFRQVAVLKGTWVTLLATLAFVLVVALVTQHQALVSTSRATLLWFGAAGVITMFVGRLLQYAGIKCAGVLRVAPIVGASPVFTLALAVSFAQERVDLLLLAGTLLIVAGLALVVTQEESARGV